MSRSRTSRPSSSSRTAPPTTQASSPASSCCASSRIDDPPDAAGMPGRITDSARELVVDRRGDTRVLLEQQAVANERNARPDGKLAGELDRHRVHRHRSHDPLPPTVDQHLRPGQVPPEAVRVTDRDDPDPRLALGDEAAPVTSRLPRPQELDLGEVAAPREHRLEAVVAGIAAKRREAVERDAGADGVEAAFREAERAGAVRSVALEPERVRRGAEAVDLHAGEAGVAVGARKVRHDGDHVARGARQLGEPPAAHAGVELEMHRYALGNRPGAHGELEARLARRREVLSGPHHQNAGVREGRPQRQRLLDGRDAERFGSLRERHARDIERSVAVTVGLDDGPQGRALDDAPQPPDVSSQRAEIDRELRARVDHDPRAAGRASITSEATRPAGLPAARAARRCATAPAAAAVRASRPLARNAATTPVSTSPVPALASAGTLSLTTHTPSRGAPTSVSGPFRRTTQPNRSTARATAWSRCASTQADSSSSRRPSSPEWGVNTVSASRATGSKPSRASASTTAGTPVSRSSRRTSSRSRSPRPSPGPIARARALSAAAITSSSGRLTASSTSVSSTGSDSAGAATATYPASARKAARAQSAAAPVIPRAPPTTRTNPAVYLLSPSRLRGTRSRSSAPTSACVVARCSSPMSATTTSPERKRPGPTTRPTLSPCIVMVTSATTASPGTSPVEASTPDGMSTATTGAGASLIRRIRSAASARGAPENPVPNSASTTTSASLTSVDSSASSPSSRSSRTAIRPSPPFAPLPQTARIRRACG